MKFKIFISFFLFILTQCYITYAQVTADFTANITVGCAPQIISFTNNSTPSTGLTYKWDFGNGNVSSLQNPGPRNYINSGVFDVTLIVSDGTNTDTLTKTAYITIHASPVPSFIASTTQGCNPLTVGGFINSSTIGGAPDNTSSFMWDFGDGTTNTIKNPVHTYNFAGTFTVSLTVTSTNNCISSADSINYITVFALPDIDFNANDTSFCTAPQNITFTSVSSQTLTYNWNFGDPSSGANNTSTTANPSHTYNALGSYTPSVTVTDQNTCTNTVTKTNYIKMNPVVASFNITEGAIVCKNDSAHFVNASTSANSYNWNFGDGSSSTLANPAHLYTSSGTYTVTLISILNASCADTTTSTITVESVIASFTSTPSTSCLSPLLVSYDASGSTAASTFDWRFGDYNTSSGVTTTNNFIHHGFFNDTLIITSTHGCKDTLVKPNNVTIHPFAHFFPNPYRGCVPLTINFTDLSSTNGVDTIVSWAWDFNNGHTSTLANPVDSFVTAGNYMVSLIVTNNNGCIDTAYSLIRVGTPQNSNYFISADTSCVSSLVNFYDISTSQSLIDERIWSFGDGYSDTTKNPVHLFNTTGWMHPSLVVGYNGCFDTLSLGDSIFIKGPTVNFVADTLHGCTPFTVHFTDSTTSNIGNITTWAWDFGDGTTDATQNPIHVYNQPGSWTDSLFVTDVDGCTASKAIHNYISTIQATASFYSPSKVYCKGDSVLFIATSTGSNYIYNWNFGDSISSTGDTLYNIVQSTAPNPTYIYKAQGDFTITLNVTDSLGCSNKLVLTNYIQIQDINADFIVANADTNCYPFPIHITNNTSNTYNPTYYWSYGDGGASYGNATNHNYTKPGVYYLKLTATTSHGCINLDSIKINVGGPYAKIFLSNDTICKGDEITLKLKDTLNIANWNWDFGDGTNGLGDITTDSIPVNHIYTDSPNGYFVPSVIYCSDANRTCCHFSTDTLRISPVSATFQAFNNLTHAEAYSGCSPFALMFVYTGVDAVSWDWNFGDGSTWNDSLPPPKPYSNLTNSSIIDSMYLAVINSYGCKDTVRKTISIFPPVVANLNPDTSICWGNSVNLNDNGDSTNIYNWSPETYLDDTSSWNPLTTPDFTTEYIATITSIYGCSTSDTTKVTVYQMPTFSISADTSIIIGDTVRLNANSSIEGVAYIWSPAKWLNCTDCQRPMAQPMLTTYYKVYVKDTTNCFSELDSVKITVKVAFTIDVPTAFTPNGEEANRIVKVRGWGIKRLLEFKIYNRWGQLVFSSDDINKGWDGTFNGVEQGPDTYIYHAVVETWNNGKTLSKKGNILLIR